MEIRETPTAEAGMLIRRPVVEVFEAIVDPAITTKFWFTHGSGRLDSGKAVRWEWRMYGVSTTATVSEIVRNEKIVMQWSDPPTTVVWTFTEMPDDANLSRGPELRLCRHGRRTSEGSDRFNRWFYAGAGGRQGLAGTGPDAGADRRPPPEGGSGRRFPGEQPIGGFTGSSFAMPVAGLRLLAPPRQHVEPLDQRRKRHRGVDVALGHVVADAVGDQRHADHQQEAQRQHHDRSGSWR